MRRVIRQHHLTHLLAFFVLLFIGIPFLEASAQTPTYTPLVGIPELVGKEKPSLAEYFNQLYLLTIVVGCFIAVLKISLAGVKWALSEVVTDKSSARSDIEGALLGLAILLVPFIVLNTINPNLTNLNILQNAGRVRVDIGAPSPYGTTPASTSPTYMADSAVRAEEQRKNACTNSKSADGKSGIYDPVTKGCSFPAAAGAVTYTRDQLSEQLNDEWKKKCGEGKLRTTTNKDGSRTYSCAQ